MWGRAAKHFLKMRCAIFGCKNTSNYPSPYKNSFFSFPKDKELCAKWVYLCGRKNEINPVHAKVCFEHFCADDIARNELYERYGIQMLTKKLKKGSIPSQKLPKNVAPPRRPTEFNEYILLL